MSKKKKTIFLVDDDVTNLTLGGEMLEPHYDVVTMDSGYRLLKMLERFRPSLILLDVDMPFMSGYETMRYIKENDKTKDVPVIFLTAKSNSEDELQGLSMGAFDYIVKPFSPSLLLKRIEMIVTLEGQREELMSFNSNLQQMVEERTKQVAELQFAVLKTMAVLVDSRDSFTGGHIDRVQNYLRLMLEAIAESGKYDDEVATWDIELILQSSLLHDVGKIAIEDAILSKPARLESHEFERIKVHVTFGAQVIEDIKSRTSQHAFLEFARTMAISHHERWNGTGYPNKLSGEEIPFLGRILAIADVYDALVSERPYKKPFSHEQAVDIIKEDSGQHFDPGLVDIFLANHQKFEELSKLYLVDQSKREDL